MMTNTPSLCQKLGGLRNRLFSMANLQWKTTPILQHERNAFEITKLGSLVEYRRCSRTTESTSGFR